MRIGVVTGEYPPMQGGVGAYSQILAQTLAQQGHKVYVFTAQRAASPNHALPVNPAVRHWGWKSLRAIRRWAQENLLDIISLQFETAAFAMSPWIHFLPDFLRDIPVVTTFHDLLAPYLFPKAGLLRDWIVMRLASMSAGVIVTNHEDMARLHAQPNTTLIPIGSNILSTIPDDSDRSLWRAEAGASEKHVLLAHFGFLNHSKGVETLLTALAELTLENYPVKLVMIGGKIGSSDPSNAAFATRIDALIERLDLVAHVHWTGFVNDPTVAAYLKASDAVVLPYLDGASYRRGSLMAAIQHGCAIITTTPTVEIPTFRHGENMLLFPAGNVKKLVELIKQLHQDSSLHDRIAAGALALRTHFQWDQIAKDHIALFNRILETHPT